MDASKPVLMIQPGFAGDILFCAKIAIEWAARGHRVIFPIEPRFADIAAAVEFPPGIETPLTNAPFALSEAFAKLLQITEQAAAAGDFSFHNGPLELQDLIVLPLASSWRLGTRGSMAAKYSVAGVEMDDWADHVRLRRDPERERRLLAELGIHDGRDFVLVNETGSTRTIPVKLAADVVRMRKVDGFSLIDWAAVAERAREIITIDTSLVLLVEVLKLKTPLQMISRHDPPNFVDVTPIIRLDWHLAATVADLRPLAARGHKPSSSDPRQRVLDLGRRLLAEGRVADATLIFEHLCHDVSDAGEPAPPARAAVAG